MIFHNKHSASDFYIYTDFQFKEEQINLYRI